MSLNIKIVKGSSRYVILIGTLAYKLPRIAIGHSRKWINFLQGLIANCRESELSSFSNELCPTVLNLFGFMLVMNRAESLSDSEWEQYQPIRNSLGENKKDSYGKLKGRIVVLDYGD
jgi:hypothetical protein